MEITLSGNTRYMVFQCAMIFDRLYDKARNLKNNYSDRLCLEGDDLKKWQQDYYPNLVETGILKNGSFFDAKNAAQYGVSRDGSFSKAGYCNILYECFRILANETPNLPCLKEVTCCCSMLAGFVNAFAGNQ